MQRGIGVEDLLVEGFETDVGVSAPFGTNRGSEGVGVGRALSGDSATTRRRCMQVGEEVLREGPG
jgi:hypothetical protein